MPAGPGEAPGHVLAGALLAQRLHAALWQARVRRGVLVFVSPPMRTDRQTMICGGTGGVAP
jgi:hypothetical protein